MPGLGRRRLKFRNSVWFPLGFTAVYATLAWVRVRSGDSLGTIVAVSLATVSAMVLWAFYGIAFLLKVRQWAAILILAGLAAPAVVFGTFALVVFVGSAFR